MGEIKAHLSVYGLCARRVLPAVQLMSPSLSALDVIHQTARNRVVLDDYSDDPEDLHVFTCILAASDAEPLLMLLKRRCI